MKLYVLARYRNQQLGIVGDPGDELDVDEATAEQLERDSPDSFSRKKPAKRQQTEGEDRMVRNAANRGDRGKGETMTSGNMPGVSRKAE